MSQGDAELLPAICRLVDARPTYGYRRIAALLNRQRRAADQPPVNRKRVHRIMANHAMILEKHTAVRIGRVHDGKVHDDAVLTSAGARTALSSAAGMARWSVSRSSSMRLTGKSSHGQPSPMPGYPFRHPRHDVGGRREALRRNQRPAFH